VNRDLLLSSYDYDLDESFIAIRPEQRRSNAKLLVYNVSTGQVVHSLFSELPQFLPADSLIVFNNSKVFKARLLGNKSSGARVELFVLSLTTDSEGSIACLIKSARKKRVGDILLFAQGVRATITHCQDDGTFRVKFSIASTELSAYLEQYGKIPIPPYIRSGESDQQDEDDYQTVYAKREGSVACPTAGLHFDNELLTTLASKNIERAEVTLHVGLGTFLPVKVDNLQEHKMHSEQFFIEEQELKKIEQAKFITAVGTTSLRVLESIYGQQVEPQKLYSTDIFLHPGVEVKSINALVTNFHLPKSTLLMLVSSLIGREKTLELYAIAKEHNYRFFSYGDGMLILR
jgi:S-adenosylmethionine:tRNA ribosyltransferase-isomerase